MRSVIEHLQGPDGIALQNCVTQSGGDFFQLILPSLRICRHGELKPAVIFAISASLEKGASNSGGITSPLLQIMTSW